ncbi:hypothetical protein C8R46DRAFT_1214113 [Mycena filopes]|nr:hypothetical protein C8R46DRAFT_1214113 [Mycena filopes]
MSGRISVYGFPFVGKLVFFPVLIAVRSFLFVPVQPLHRDMEALKDDWNDFNDLDYSANKFGASNPRVRSNIRSVSCSSVQYLYGFLFIGKLVFFPALIAVSSFLFVPVQLLHRDMEALKDDWNDFNDLDYSANKFGASNPRVRSNIRSVSCSSLLHRDMEALKDDWNDFNDLDYSANKFGASNPRVRSNIRSVSCSSPLHRDMEALKDDWNDFNDLDYSANKFGASNPRVRSNIRSLSCSSYLPRVFVPVQPFYRHMDAFNDDWNESNILFIGKLVFFPALIAVRSFLFVPVQPFYRDMDAFDDDWNEFHDLDYLRQQIQTEFAASNPPR